MKQVQSADGTTIAYDQMGNGPAVILVDGALGSRALGFLVPLATELSPHFTIITYDRRGRGDALGLFMLFVGMPPEHLEGARQQPTWPMWEAVAHTLPYDAAALGEDGSVPTEKAARVPVPMTARRSKASALRASKRAVSGNDGSAMMNPLPHGKS